MNATISEKVGGTEIIYASRTDGRYAVSLRLLEAVPPRRPVTLLSRAQQKTKGEAPD